MKNIFENSRSCWVRYDCYELKTASDGSVILHLERTQSQAYITR